MTLRSRAARTAPEARVTALIERHGASLLRTAQKVSLCADDAHDAFQRALEIYLRRLDTVDPTTELHWLRVVVRNEALAVRRQRSQHVAGDDVDFDSHRDEGQRPVDERLAAEERVRRSAEAVRKLKPDEAKALLLKAQGHSYDEIGRRYGWTYTKVNRSIAEGRKRFFTLFSGIESGEACDALAPTLAAVAYGEASAEALLELRPHLRHCARCRAEVRRLHGGRLARVAALLPFPGLFDRARAELAGLVARFSDPVAASAASGGGRGTATAAIVAVAIGGVGAGGYGAATGKLPDPAAAVRAATGEREAPARTAARAASAPPAAAATPAAEPPLRRIAVVAGDVRPRRAAASPEPRKRAAEKPATRRKDDARAEEFGFEGDAPAAAPATAPAVAAAAEAAPAASAPAPAPVAPVPAASPPAPAAAAPAGDFGFER